MESFLQSIVLTCRPPPRRTSGPIKSQSSEMIAFESAAYTLTRKQMDAQMVEMTVTVEAHPFGMNVKLGDVPSVVHVEAGSAAEAEGVRTGDVVTAVNGIPVDAENWYDAYSSAELPIIVTLETCRYAPALFSENSCEKRPQSCDAALPGNYLGDYDEFRCDVASLPYGLRIRDDGGGRACVLLVMENSPAEAAGVLMGDILATVGNHTVSVETWHSTLKSSDLPCGLVFLRRKNMITSSVMGIGLGLAEVEPIVLSEGYSGHGALHRETCTASLVDCEDFRESVDGASAADVFAARVGASSGGQGEKFNEATSVFAAEVIDFTCDDDTTALLLQAETAADSPAPLRQETSRSVIGDLDDFAEEAIQELVVLQEVQQAQDARRQQGLELRRLQLRECDHDCNLAQQAVNELQARLDKKTLLKPTDPNDAGLAPSESESSSAEQGGQEADRAEMEALTHILATKKKRREALLHDISMWMSWMEQSQELAREHYTPFSRDDTLPCGGTESSF